jgi:hypothetical protein
LGIAASFGGLSSTDQAELELESVSSLVADIGEIGASWPTELSAERAAVLDQRIGPYERRAQRGVDALRAIGLSDDELAGVSAAWRSALAVRDPSVPVIDVAGLSDDVRAKLAAAATSYDAQVTPFGQDPSLVVDSVDAPATDAYLAAHCPDLAASGVGDSL